MNKLIQDTNTLLQLSMSAYTVTDYNLLVDIIQQHTDLYHRYQNPIISDYEYDQLFGLCKQIETKHPDRLRLDSPTQRVGSDIQEGFVQARHHVPLLSLENSYNAQDLVDRNIITEKMLSKLGIQNHTFFMEPKFDGVSIELVYNNGTLTQAITRGNGIVGDDVTQNVRTIHSVPLLLKQAVSLCLRGEIVMPKSAFERVNNERAAAGEDLFANPRNVCAGSLRQLDPRVTASRGLIFKPYEILSIDTDIDAPLITQGDQLNYLHDIGFTIDYWTCEVGSIDEVVQICVNSTTFEEFMSHDIEYDGIVIKVNELNLCQLLGSTDHHPRRGMAYKFPAQQVATTLLGVEFQVGRTGIITPVGQVESVQLSGATIAYVSLHNFDVIKNKDIRIGDRVWIQRSGEVIPYVVGPITQTRTGDEQTIFGPDLCPICGHHTFIEDEDTGGYLLYCPNPSCPAQIKERITHFVSRDCMDIEGLGYQIIELLVDQGIIHTFADVYKLTQLEYRPILNALPGFQSKRIDNISASLEKSKSTKLWRILAAIGIRHVGTRTAKLIIESIEEAEIGQKKLGISGIGHEQVTSNISPSLKVLCDYLTNSEFLNQIHRIGEKTVKTCLNWFSDSDNIALLQQLADAGVQFDNRETDKRSSTGPLSGVRFAVTGLFGVSRNEISQQLVKLGAEYCENITKNVTHLIVGRDSSSKVSKAQKNGIALVQGLEGIEQEWNVIIGQGDSGGLF